MWRVVFGLFCLTRTRAGGEITHTRFPIPVSTCAHCVQINHIPNSEPIRQAPRERARDPKQQQRASVHVGALGEQARRVPNDGHDRVQHLADGLGAARQRQNEAAHKAFARR